MSVDEEKRASSGAGRLPVPSDFMAVFDHDGECVQEMLSEEGSDGDSSFYHEMLDMTLPCFWELLSDLRRMRDQRPEQWDYQPWIAVHELRGCCLGFGFQRLINYARDLILYLRHVGPDVDPSDLETIIGSLKSLFIQAYLRAKYVEIDSAVGHRKHEECVIGG